MKSSKLSTLEQLIMDLVWECDTCSVRCVLEKLPPHKKLAYTTVATILQRLYEKGLVTRETKGITLVYQPKMSKAAYSATIFESFIDTFLHTFGDSAIASFADSIDKLPAEKKAQLLKLLENETEG